MPMMVSKCYVFSVISCVFFTICFFLGFYKCFDVWSLGVTLYAFVYGQVPFVASTIPDLYKKIQTQPLLFRPKPAISADLRDLIFKILQKDPNKRITLKEIKNHPWVTQNGQCPLPTEEENCRGLVEITEEDVARVVKSIPKLDTLILIKTMLKNHSFQNPFLSDSLARKFQKNGRSNSTPVSCDWHGIRALSCESNLASVTEAACSEQKSPDHRE